MADDFGSIAGAAGGVAGGIIGAVGSIFGANAKAQADQKEASLYDTAATLEGWNSTYAQESSKVQDILATRQYNQTFGAQKAQVGANGFQMSGSNLDIMREGWNTFGITKGMINMQSGIQQANFQNQGVAYEAQAASARAAASAAQTGGLLGALGSVVGAVGSVAKLIP